jgi:hypothetical protein
MTGKKYGIQAPIAVDLLELRFFTMGAIFIKKQTVQ